MDPIIAIFVLRFTALIIAAVLAFFGYKLFLVAPQAAHGQGEVKLSGIGFKLSRIGPGVFFSLFSAAVVIAGLAYPIKIRSLSQEATLDITGAVPVFTGESPAPAAAQSSAADIAHAKAAVGHLRCMAKRGTNEDEQTAVDKAAIAILGSVWQNEWGDFQAFRRWAIIGSGSAPAAEEVRQVFSAMDPRCG